MIDLNNSMQNSRVLFTQEQIIYEDNHLLIVNKKSGQLVQEDKTGDESLFTAIKAFIKERDGKPRDVFLGLVHRIDRPTSGALIYAKTSKALSRLVLMLKDREIKKTYWAIVPREAIPPSQRLENYLKKNAEKNRSFVCSEDLLGAKKAILSYRILKTLDHYLLLEIDLETGRHHQIRVQLSKIGIPIRGDLKYGAPRSNSDGGISLHARKLEFIHPVTKEPKEVIAPVNGEEEIWKFCE